jgi:ubiquitin-protein ligase
MDLVISRITKFLLTEVMELQSLATNNDVKFLLDESPADDPVSNIFLGRLFPKSNIYNQAAFQIEIKLPSGYPFNAPEVRFVTPIYHPNVDDKGRIRLDMLDTSIAFNRKRLLRDIVIAVANLIDNPNVDHAVSLGEVLF